MLQETLLSTDARHGRRPVRWRRPPSGLAAARIGLVVSLVAASFQLDPKDVIGARRGVARIAFARQVAMYLAHVWLGLTLSEVGRCFTRDRTTVAHACIVVEDRRENPRIDRMLDVMETAVTSWQDMAHDIGGRS